ncbi:Glycosyl transferase, family 25 [Cordyceps fumosorosea ARSEF 2679]|uniref:Glycosyl transferase, family 25 n=1 Tax=Cordyceps fumosorosea (strain ARSEF 2679) TaxID=1081104 RepID=A0A162K4M5_CORFA|nr:Glycosyl transferase, family 25 [Cordyceps fumosorosea ARSEF 2679]OAA53268.1 Glycosyl transferase, family 25 [Cordyceps fumosorosea ARSEF 2679]
MYENKGTGFHGRGGSRGYMATLKRKPFLVLLAAVSLLFLLYQRQHFINPLPGGAMYGRKVSGLLDDINNSTLGFERIFVMGLPDRTDRRDQMVLQAGLSNIAIEFIDSVRGGDINPKAIPAAAEEGEKLSPGAYGCWRGHMNALQEIVRRNITSALVLEDDSDWDVRIRSLLIDTALATRALTQPLQGTGRGTPARYADPTYPEPSGSVEAREFSIDALPATAEPRVSPYGDEWEMLWLGHCGVSWPVLASDDLPFGRVFRYNDTSVPGSGLYSLSNPYLLKDEYPKHTRAFHHVEDGVCSLGYAVTQKGARGLLRELALRGVSDPLDFQLRHYCKGMKGRRKHKCIAAQPPLFSHHRGVGLVSAGSNIDEHGEGYRSEAKTDMVRWSVALNADKIMDGKEDYLDGFPDE